MPENHKSISRPTFETILLSLMLGLLIAWGSKDPFFSLVSGGTSLSVRSPLVQIGFLILLVLLIASLLLFGFQKQLQWLLSHAWLPFFALPLIPLAAHGYIGTFSRFVADDFSSATLAVNKGILGATWDWYVNWSGRFSASFFDSLFGYLGPSSMPWETGAALLLLLIGMTAFIARVLRVNSVVFRASLAAFLSALILTATFALAPDLGQSLYWGQGMRSLIFPLIPASFLAANFQYLADQPDRRIPAAWLAIIGLISFIAGGFGETYVTIQTTVLGLWLILVFLNRPGGFRHKLTPALITALLCSLAAMLVTIAAPGNRIRQTYFPPSPDLVHLLSIAFRSLGVFLGSLINSWTHAGILLVVFIASICAGYLYADEAKTYPAVNSRQSIFSTHPFFQGPARTAATLFILTALLILACFVPAAYGMSAAPPDRTQIIPVLLLCITLTLSGTLLGKYLHAQGFALKISTIKSRLLIWVLFFLASFYTYQVTTQILSVLPDYRHFAADFDAADQMIREARAGGMPSVKVPEVHNQFGLSDYGAGTTFWLDEAVNSYYGIEVIVDKNMQY